MSLIIRAAEPAEADTIWRVTLEAYAPDRERIDPPSGVFKETVADVRRAMEQGTVYVAVSDDAIVGVARAEAAVEGEHGFDSDALYCGRLAVLPSRQRHGVGTELMRCVERHAAECGYPAVVLGVRVGLPELLRFYQRLGYRVVGEATHGGYPGPTFYRLRKELSQ